MDALYNRFNFDAWTEPANLVIETMHRILSRFERVVVIRTLLKQDMVPAELQNSPLRDTLQNHRHGWELFQERLSKLKQIKFHVTDGFVLEDFFPLDNHWTPEGNCKFARLVRQSLQ